MKQIDIVGRRKIWFTISIVLIVIAILASFFPGVKLDIQFSGGTIVTYSFNGDLDKGEFQSSIENSLGQKVSLREQNDVNTGATNYVITLNSKSGVTPDQQIAVNTALNEKFPGADIQTASISNVDPSIGRDFLLKSVVAVAVASILMIVYIAFRFRKMNGWSAGVIAVAALVHDLIIAYGAFVVCGFPLNDSFIAVMLTILGYSINNTIIVYDRIRENRRLEPTKSVDALPGIVNKSLNQTMTRSILTSLTTFLALLVIYIVAAAYGLTTVKTFALPMMVGVVVGCYTSLCIAAPLHTVWAVHKAKKK